MHYDTIYIVKICYIVLYIVYGKCVSKNIHGDDMYQFGTEDASGKKGMGGLGRNMVQKIFSHV